MHCPPNKNSYSESYSYFLQNYTVGVKNEKILGKLIHLEVVKDKRLYVKNKYINYS